MRKVNIISAFWLLLFLSLAAFTNANDNDKNVIIESKNETYKFVKGKGDHPVTIQEEFTVKYKCTEVRSGLYFSEMYDDTQTIDDVDIYTNGKKAKYITPHYEYYAVKDVFYSDARICYFELPLGAKDATAEVRFKRTHKDPRYFSKIFFTEEYFTENKTITIIIPRWMKCEIKELNFGTNQIQKKVEFDSKENADVYTFTASQIEPFKNEFYSPGPTFIYPHLLVLSKEAETDYGAVTYFKTIADQYKWCYNLVQQVEDDKTKLADKAKEITNAITNDIDKVKAIYNWVQQNVRYIAFEDGIAGFKPAKATDVMTKKYGDCKGMANLIKGLLKGINLDARLCWIGTNHIAYDLSTPMLNVHNHMITALVYNGKTYFLDGTETNIGFNEYAARIEGRQVLIEDGANYILTNIPKVNYTQNVEKEIRVLEIKDNNLIGTASHVYKGESKSGIINNMQNVKKDNLDKALIKFLSEDNQDYAISNLKTSPLIATDTALTFNYSVDYKNGISAFGNELYLEADYRKDVGSFKIDTAKRTHDMELPCKLSIDYETEITIPNGYKVSFKPADLNIKNNNIIANVTYTQKGNKLLYKKEIILLDTRVKKADFSAWNTLVKQLNDKYKEQVILSK